jgi:ribosomal protein S18 acetylase RimI-like enzyme
MEPDSIRRTEIGRLRHAAEAEVCARMMAKSEPWITLQRDFDTSLGMITDRSREVYLATIDGQVAGFIVLVMRGAFVGYIQSICVAPEWRGQGIGSQLMAYAERRIFSETPNAFICVSSFNRGARRLYERLGYEVIGELEDYIIRGHSEILLRKTIAPWREFRKDKRRHE